LEADPEVQKKIKKPDGLADVTKMMAGSHSIEKIRPVGQRRVLKMWCFSEWAEVVSVWSVG